MSYEMIVGLHVSDDSKYSEYRNAMMPLLQEFGGGFRYDFVVSQVLKNEEGRPINRVFNIYFKDKDSRDLFFTNPKYLEIRNDFFESSVTARTVIAEYNKE